MDESYAFDPTHGQLPPKPEQTSESSQAVPKDEPSSQQHSHYHHEPMHSAVQQSPSRPQQQQQLPPKPAGPMPKEQTKYSLAILRTLKKKSEAGPFLAPVDPIALGIPHYSQVVTHPMDLGTVESKLQKNVYAHVEEFLADMRRIWENCYTFNGLDNPISHWAKTLSAIFEKQAAKMPTPQTIAATQAAKRSQSPNDAKKAATAATKKARRVCRFRICTKAFGDGVVADLFLVLPCRLSAIWDWRTSHVERVSKARIR